MLLENTVHKNSEVGGSGFFLCSAEKLLMYRDCLWWQWRFSLLQGFYFESEKLKGPWSCLISAACKLELLRLYLTHQLNLNILYVILCSARGPLFISSLLSKNL